MSENNNGYNTTTMGQAPAETQIHAGDPRAPRPRRKHSNVRVYINQLIATAICVAIIWGSGIAVLDGIRLAFISDEITSMGVIPAETDHPKNIRYNELLDERVAIGNSSWIGNLLVQAGGHWVTKIIRMVALVIAFFAILCAGYLIIYIIREDIKFLWRKIAKRLGFKSKAKRRNRGKRSRRGTKRRQRRSSGNIKESNVQKAEAKA